MKSVLRALLGLLAGLMTAVALIATLEALGHRLWPLPPGSTNPTNPAELAELLKHLPWPALANVVASWCLGAAGGAWIALRLAGKDHGRKAALGVGGVIWLATGAQLLSAAHPLGMVIGGLVGVPLCTLAVLFLGRRRTDP